MDQELRDKYEVVIGLEVHAQLKTKSKIFAPDKNEFGQEPNSLTSPITLGMPGVLPVLNKECVNMGILTGLALNCEIPSRCKFDRKQYFYPDLPKGYQISQYDEPICVNGHIEIDGKRIGITRAHLEEDAGKLVHAGANGIAGSTYSLVDLNRAGTPLLEIVSEPDMRSSEEAKNYMEELRNIVRYIGVCDGNLEEGSMRCDANISIMPKGSKEFGTRAEIKNVNSFAALQRAIEYEIERQIEIVEEGGEVVQETRLWDDASRETRSMRGKEDAKDYRYFPDPDLPPIHISDAWIEKIKAEQPELREVKQARYQEEYGLPAYDAGILTESRHLAGLFEETAAIYGNAKKTANWFMGEVLRLTKDKAMDPEQVSFSPKHLADLLVMVEKSEVSPQNAKKVFEKVFEEDIDPVAYIEEHGLKIVEDTGLLEETINRILDANPGPLSELLGGKDKVMGFFVGQIMKEMKGKANPASVRETLMKEVEKRK